MAEGGREPEEFSLFATARRRFRTFFSPQSPRPITKEYRAKLYYSDIKYPTFRSHLFILPNLEMYFETIERDLTKKGWFEEGASSIVEFEGEEISLRIGETTKINDDWEIIPLNEQVVRKSAIDGFSFENCHSYGCQMKVRCIAEEGKKVDPLEYKMMLKGAQGKRNFIFLESPLAFTERVVPNQSTPPPTEGDGASDISPHPQQQSSPVKSLGIDDLYDVLLELSDVKKKWNSLGLALGLRQPTLEGITDSDVEECKKEMLKKWLNKVDPKCDPSWNTLVVALESNLVQHKLTADAIKEKYLL